MARPVIYTKYGQYVPQYGGFVSVKGHFFVHEGLPKENEAPPLSAYTRVDFDDTPAIKRGLKALAQGAIAAILHYVGF